jgi:DUF2917 family protein
MDNELRHPLTDLRAGSILRMSNALGRAVLVFEGEVWITQDGDQRDIVLAGGESFSVDHPGLTLVEALRDTKLTLVEDDLGTAQRVVAESSYTLYQMARQQRGAAIARGLHKAWAALRRVVARASTRPAARPAQRPLRVCVSGR